MPFLWRCYHKIFRPRRCLAQFADSLCRHSDVWFDFDPHLIRQATKRQLKLLALYRMKDSFYSAPSRRTCRRQSTSSLACWRVIAVSPGLLFDAVEEVRSGPSPATRHIAVAGISKKTLQPLPLSDPERNLRRTDGASIGTMPVVIGPNLPYGIGLPGNLRGLSRGEPAPETALAEPDIGARIKPQFNCRIERLCSQSLDLVTTKWPHAAKHAEYRPER